MDKTREVLGKNSQVVRLRKIVKQTKGSLVTGVILLVFLFFASVGYAIVANDQLESTMYLNQYRIASKALTTAVQSYAVSADEVYYDAYMKELNTDKNREIAWAGLEANNIKDYEKELKMTKQEVKDEYKQTEGNPEIKGRIRRIQRQMALSRMMQKVPEADVIVRNPTHFAVALKYDPDRHGAPVVLAKGQDELALRIVKAGEENGVFIIENKPLARALYASCRLDQEIPAEFYGAVAEILIYIYRASHREDMFQ